MVIALVGILVGVVVTAGATYWSVLAARHSGRGRIDLLVLDCFYPRNDAEKVFGDLSIRLGGVDVAANIAVLKACFVNTSSTEIDKDQVRKPLSVVLPEGYAWRRAAISAKSPNTEAICEITDARSLAFRWDLLRPREFFQFHAIVETPTAAPDKEARQILAKATVQHRIARLDRSQVKLAPPELRGKAYFRTRIVKACAMATAGLMLFAFVLYFSTPPHSAGLYALEYRVADASEASTPATLKVRGPFEYSIVDQTTGASQTIDVRSAANKPLMVTVAIADDKSANANAGMMSFAAGMLLTGAVSILLEVRRMRAFAGVFTSGAAAAEPK